MHRDDHDHQHEHDLGLAHDVSTMVNRRRSLSLLGGAGLVALAACSSGLDPRTTGSTGSTSSTSAGDATTTTTTADGSSCAQIPEETGGPYPGDGSNGVNVLDQSGIVRSDITSSFGSSTTVAQGVPLTVSLTVLDTANGCAPLTGAAVYLWHCDREGRYSMYTQGVTNENYLRGVQATDADGAVTFRSIFPAAYQGRWPHIHFEVYPSVDAATASSGKLRTSQLAFPQDVCETVYATSGYEASVRNLAETSLERDMVFRDGWSLQLATMGGAVDNGYTAELAVSV
jgi:protocatechuate 3,4-dioxygenase beta subunit